MKTTVRVKVPATTANLGPGFDVLGAALTMYNELEVVFDKRRCPDVPVRPEIEIEGEGKDTLPRDSRNIVWQSMKKVFSQASRPVPQIRRLRLVNHIPLTSGLGSSAAARLCGILAANIMCGGMLSEEAVLSLGVKLEGHPDNIVPALVGGLCVSFIDEGKVKYVKLPAPRLKAVVCNPNFELATEQARKVLPKNFTMPTAVFNLSRLALLMAAFQSGRYDLLSVAMEDRFHQPSRAPLIPGMCEVFAAAKKAGAFGAALSGAGPSVVALCAPARAKEVGRQMSVKWEQFNIASRSFVLGFDPRGAAIEKN